MGQIAEDIKIKGLSVFKNNESTRLLTHVNSCVHCGLCAESCIYYRVFQDEHYIPAKKVDIVSSVFRRYNTAGGRLIPWLTKARELDEETIEEMVDLLYGTCTMCDRCNAHCSIGIDIGYLVRTGRSMLANMGYVPKTLQSSVDAALNSGNNMSITDEEFVDTIKWLEEDLQFEVNDDKASIQLNEKGKNILYTLNPREPKFFPLSISAMAKVFYAAGESWTLSTKMYDVTNYAYFSGDDENAAVIAQRMCDEMLTMDAEKCVLAECGHGVRTFRFEAPNYMKRSYTFNVVTSIEMLAKYIREGKIKVDPEKFPDKVTLHDPCNLVRGGGIFGKQRYILNNCVNDFVEMNPSGNNNLCCGGGGGQLAMSEYTERRLKIGGLKAEQIKKTGAKIVATPCHNCVDQLTQLNAEYKLDIKVMTLAEIVADALVLDS